MVAGLRYRSPQPFSTATLVSVDHLPYFDSSLVLLMDAALEAAKNHILEYYEHYQVIDVPEGATALAALPLVPAPRGKKSMKEFFHIVNNISHSDREAIVGAFVNGSLNVAALPVSIRPRDSLGESVKMQLVIEDSGDACHVLKFFHSNVEIPSGLARAWCDSRILSIDYRVANNSHLVKVAFMKACGHATRGNKNSENQHAQNRFLTVYVYMCIYICICIYVFVIIYIYAYMYVYIYIHIHICIYIYIQMYIYMYIHIQNYLH